MKRFGAVCALACAVIFLAAGCNDYGNTFQGNTGASLTSISPSNTSVVSAGGADLTLTLFGGGFVAKTVAQWNGKTLATTPVTDANNTILRLTAVVPASLLATPGTAFVNTLSPHSGSQDNGLSNPIAFIINPPPNPLPVLNPSLSPGSAAPGSATLTLTLNGSNFIPSSDPTGGSLVHWNSNGTQTTLTTTSVSATQIQATVDGLLLATQTCATVSVFNPPAIATTPPSGVSNPFSGGGGTSAITPASRSRPMRNSSRTATNLVPIPTPLKLPLWRWRKKPLRSDSMAASSSTPPRKTDTHKFSCVIPARARQLVASRKLPPFPSRTTAHKATQTATLPQ